MNKFIGYFDLLGYKEFLLVNTELHLQRRANHILRDIETSLSEKLKELSGGFVADLSDVNINCLNISDTIIFWSMDDTIEGGIELLNVCYRFNWKLNQHNFPVRGSIVYENFAFITGKQHSTKGAVYSPNLMYGKGLLHAHEKTELLNWAGTVIDNTVVEKMWIEAAFQDFLKKNTILYNIPYKGFYKKEYALRLVIGKLNEKAFINYKRDIIRCFENDNKSITPSVEEKMNNTIEFLKGHKE